MISTRPPPVVLPDDVALFEDPLFSPEPVVVRVPSKSHAFRLDDPVLLAQSKDCIWYTNVCQDKLFEYRTVEVPFPLAAALPQRNLTEGETRSIGITQSMGWENFARNGIERNVLLFRKSRTGVSSDSVTERINNELKEGFSATQRLLENPGVASLVRSGCYFLQYPMCVYDSDLVPSGTGRIFDMMKAGTELVVYSAKELVEFQREVIEFALNIRKIN